MVRFNSLIELVSSGTIRSEGRLLIQGTNGVGVDALAIVSSGGLKLSAEAEAGQLYYQDNTWKIVNNNLGDAPQPIVSGLDDVPGPAIDLIPGNNIIITPNPAANTITIDAAASGINSLVVDGTTYTGDITFIGSSGVDVRVSDSSTIVVVQDDNAFIVGYSGTFPTNTANEFLPIYHNMGTNMVSATFYDNAGGSYQDQEIFPDAFMPSGVNTSLVRWTFQQPFWVVMFGYKGI